MTYEAILRRSRPTKLLLVFWDLRLVDAWFAPIFLHHIFYTNFLRFLHQFFAFFTPIFCLFYTNFLRFLHQFFAFFTPIFGVFCTNFFKDKIWCKKIWCKKSKNFGVK